MIAQAFSKIEDRRWSLRNMLERSGITPIPAAAVVQDMDDRNSGRFKKIGLKWRPEQADGKSTGRLPWLQPARRE